MSRKRRKKKRKKQKPASQRQFEQNQATQSASAKDPIPQDQNERSKPDSLSAEQLNLIFQGIIAICSAISLILSIIDRIKR
jgi:hypothetical protein